MACYIYKINHNISILSESIPNKEIAIEYKENSNINIGDNFLGYLDSGYFTMLFTASRNSNGKYIFLNKDIQIGVGISIDKYDELKELINSSSDSIIPIDNSIFNMIADAMTKSVANSKRKTGGINVNKEDILNNIKALNGKSISAEKVIFKEKEMPYNYLVFGAPGTGKSYYINEALQNAKTSTDRKAFGDKEERCERVTFFSGYSYGNFVGSYKPIMKETEDGNEIIAYEYVPGPLIRILMKAMKDKEHNYLLIIEEINRAEAAAAFGDMFQLLDRRNNGDSEYSIQASIELRKFLARNICEGYDDLEIEEKNEIEEDYFSKIIIPRNMYIWATMNSADQGVFPLDTAFKRRWVYKYIEINDGVNNIFEGDKPIKISNILISIGKEYEKQYVKWDDIRQAINRKLISLNINEDKLMGPYFLSFDKNCFSEGLTCNCGEKNETLYLYEGKDYYNFIDSFKSKVIMYLFDDAGRMKRKELFKHDELGQNEITYYKICELIDKYGLQVLNIDDLDIWTIESNLK